MKKKGFTLIELLAVIVILAIVAVIATPAVLDVIESARRSAFEQTALGYYNATRYLYDEMFLDGNIEDINFTFKDGKQTSSNPSYKLEVQGETPKGGLIYLTSDGQIMVSISNNKYCANVNNGEVSLTDNPEDCINGITEVPSECFTITTRTLLTGNGLNNSEEWMSAEYNMLSYSSNSSCPKSIDILTIPSEVDGKVVEGISNRMFSSSNVKIKSVMMPNTIKVIESHAFESAGLSMAQFSNNLIYIGDYAFHLNKLKSIQLADGLKHIGDNAFESNQLTSIQIPNTVTYLSGFSRNKLTNVEIPNSVIRIGNHAFSQNEISNLSIPSSITYIGEAAFNDNQLPDEQAFIYQRNKDGTINNAILVSYGGARVENVVIPSNVQTLATASFEYSPVKNVIVPSGVTSIPMYAFYYSSLENISLPSSITSIYSYAFMGSKLKEIELPSGVTSIGTSAFWWCQLTSVVIPDGVTEISQDAFGHNQLTNVTLPKGLKIIRDRAFYRNKLASIELPDSLTFIGIDAFTGNELIQVDIPNGVITISDYAFRINRLTSITIPSSVTSIGMCAFNDNQLPDEQAFIYKRNSDGTIDNTTLVSYGGANRDDVVIPENVINFNNSLNENAITKLTLPDSVTNIFQSSNGIPVGLKELTLGNNVQAIQYNTINSCETLEKLTVGLNPGGSEVIANNAFYDYKTGGCHLKELVLGPSVTAIGRDAFRDNQLTSVVIPDSVTSIGSGAFTGNPITNLEIGNGVTTITSNFGNQIENLKIGINQGGNISISNAAFANQNITNLVLGPSVTSIGNGAFNNNQLPDGQAFIYKRNEDGTIDNTTIVSYGGAKRDNIVIPDNVTTIGISAFSNSQLTSITIPDGVLIVGASAFRDNQLSSLTLPAGVTDIGAYAFYGNKLTSLELPNTITNLGTYSFQNNQLKTVIYNVPNITTAYTTATNPFKGNAIEELTVGDNVIKIPNYMFYDQKINRLTMSDNITTIGNYAFRNNQLTSVTIPDSVTSLGAYAFADNQLTNIAIGKGLTNLGTTRAGYIFSNNKLANLVVPANVLSIGGSAFTNNQLTNIVFENSATKVTTGAFNNNQLPDEQAFIYKRNDDGTIDNTTIVSYGGAKRDNVIIPNGVTTISSYAFQNNALTSITIPDSVTTISTYAFRINQLTSVTIPSGVTSIGSNAFLGNKFTDVSAITILGDTTRFDSNWTAIGFPAKS